ncbi:hypothetical protein CASFOL_017895 [Castilleja foliolosa]|uniref:F-box domain-containing protein n=1 Tax=Castilleja foliolosa TaxID=1961234 RepID=A0ABD3DBB7_9LAMI
MSSVDRLSALSDDIICHILSFLPTKDSVATSVLSKRWISMWVHVPTLDFDNETSYSEDITRVISLHKAQNLNTFRLHYDDGGCTLEELQTWMDVVVERNVKFFDFLIDHAFSFYLPSFETLISLTLVCSLCGVPSSLPCLKKLHLRCDYEFDDEDLPRLLSACPVLEELTMEREFGDALYFCKIISPTLKMLTFDFPFNPEEQIEDYDVYDYKLEINAPALRYLHLLDCQSNCISAQMLTSLIDADICLDYYVEVEDDDSYLASVLKFVDSLYNVKSLKLSSGKTFSPRLFGKSTVRFDNLIKLELAIDSIFLNKFLEAADNLEVLIIRQVEDNLKHWIEPEEVPTCVLSHLRTITIEQFGYTEQEFNMILYLLRNAKVLERVKINFRAEIDSEKKSCVFELGSEGYTLSVC